MLERYFLVKKYLFNKERKDGPSSDISGDTGRGREYQKGQQRQQIN